MSAFFILTGKFEKRAHVIDHFTLFLRVSPSLLSHKIQCLILCILTSGIDKRCYRRQLLLPVHAVMTELIGWVETDTMRVY